LFSGTLLENLDPDKKYTRAELMQVISCVNLTQFVESRNGLEMTISPHGENLSTGQRQLLCLARAILRRSKIMVLDEATASVDKLTDALIQKTLRELTNTTMLTIAHRLDTIVDYDKVLVMSEGRACEYDRPQRLLLEPTSAFSQMWRMYHSNGTH
jgi:ATP-binding cassette subfamily C (CFTR/MRP) protein 1